MMDERNKPETKFGRCPACKNPERLLVFSTGSFNGKLWCDWVCLDCYKWLKNHGEGEKENDSD